MKSYRLHSCWCIFTLAIHDLVANLLHLEDITFHAFCITRHTSDAKSPETRWTSFHAPYICTLLSRLAAGKHILKLNYAQNLDMEAFCALKKCTLWYEVWNCWRLQNWSALLYWGIINMHKQVQLSFHQMLLGLFSKNVKQSCWHLVQTIFDIVSGLHSFSHSVFMYLVLNRFGPATFHPIMCAERRYCTVRHSWAGAEKLHFIPKFRSLSSSSEAPCHLVPSLSIMF